MDARMPKVSIIIPVYNGANYVREAIDSALSQTYSNIEVLVVNDGSNDNGATEKIALSYGVSIRYFAKENGGVSTALNVGIKQMKGLYFSWLSHDDVYKPDKIEKQIEFLRQFDDETTIIYGGYEIINHKSKWMDSVDYEKLYPLSQLNKSLFPVFRGLANGCTMLIHKSHFERVGLFNEFLPTTQDYDMWFRMFRDAHVRFCPGMFVNMRFHAEQTGRTTVRHDEEGDKLWMDMLSRVTKEETAYLDGTSYLFYCRSSEYLMKFSNYPMSKRFVAERITEHSSQKRVSQSNNLQYNIPSKMSTGGKKAAVNRSIYILKNEGIAATVKKLYYKLKKYRQWSSR